MAAAALASTLTEHARTAARVERAHTRAQDFRAAPTWMPRRVRERRLRCPARAHRNAHRKFGQAADVDPGDRQRSDEALGDLAPREQLRVCSSELAQVRAVSGSASRSIALDLLGVARVDVTPPGPIRVAAPPSAPPIAGTPALAAST